jgi:hypothetical protein
MSFPIIQLKQELKEIEPELNEAEIQTAINESFEQFINSPEFTNLLNENQRVNLKHTLEQIKLNLINELTENTESVRKTLQQLSVKTLNITESPALHFTAIDELQNLSATLNPELAETFHKLYTRVSQPLQKYNEFEKNRLSLIAACNELPDHQPALMDLINHIKTLSKKDITDFQANKDVVAHVDAIKALDDLQGLIKQFEEDKRPLEEKITLFQEYLAQRWEKIKKFTLSYPKTPNSKLNKLLLELATAMSEVLPDQGRLSLLMPTVSTVKSELTYTYFDDPALKLEHFILSEDNQRFIEIQACLNSAETDGIYKNTVLVDGQITALTPNEKTWVAEHSKLTYDYAKQIEIFREFSTNKFSIGGRMQKLAEGLEQGGVYHLSPTSDLAINDPRRATHKNAGEQANLAILEFVEYVGMLPESQKQMIFRLTGHGLTENFGQIYRRLTTPGAVNLDDTRYCVELLAPQIKTILRDNPDVYNINGEVSKENLQTSLDNAKNEFINCLNSDNYKLNFQSTSTKLNYEIIISLGRNLTDYMSAEELLKIDDQYFANKIYFSKQQSDTDNRLRLQFLNMCVNSDSTNIELRTRQYQLAFRNLFVPVENALIRNSLSYIRTDETYPWYYHHVWDDSQASDRWEEVREEEDRFYSTNGVDPNAWTITKVLCATVFTAITIVPYIVAVAITILGNVLTEPFWNYSKTHGYAKWSDLNDLGFTGGIIMGLAYIVARPIAATMAYTASVLSALAEYALRGVEKIAYPLIFVAAVAREGLKNLVNGLTGLFKKPESRSSRAPVVIIGTQQFVKNQLSAKKSSQNNTDYVPVRGDLQNNVIDKSASKTNTRRHFWESVPATSASAKKESAVVNKTENTPRQKN